MRTAAIFAILWVLFLGGHPSFAQCSSRIVIPDSVYIGFNGEAFTNCTIELRVDSLGYWLNETLMVPFVPFVDSLSEENKENYRTTSFYRQAKITEKSDREGLIAATRAEAEYLTRLEDWGKQVQSKKDYEKYRDKIMSDPFIQQFVADLAWSEKVNGLQCKGRFYGIWFSVGAFCWEPTKPIPSSRKWEEYLPYLMETYCKQIENAKQVEQGTSPGIFIVQRLGRSAGHGSFKHRSDALEMVKQK